jgi:hypothetical protein
MCDFESTKKLKAVSFNERQIHEPEPLEQVHISERSTDPNTKVGSDIQSEIINEDTRVRSACLLENYSN